MTFVTPDSGDNAGYGTNYFDGMGLGAILSVDFDKVAGGSNNPYLNIWVTDGTNYAIISSENDYRGTDLQTRTEWELYEYQTTVADNQVGSYDWLFSG